ncbi:MAG: cobaltochelatase subunit CobN [Hyphomonas sp.]
MHLLNIREGQVSDGAEPVDLGQSPGDIVVISAADTDLSALEAAQKRAGQGAPSLRIANLMTLQHNFSVDLYVQKVISRAKLICVRVLGGRTYWPYGIAEIVQSARENAIPLAMIPGDARPDADLEGLSTVSPDDRARLWSYLQEGGPDNVTAFLQHTAYLVGYSPDPGPPPEPLARAGLYWPGEAPRSLEGIKLHWARKAPTALIIFYRAYYLAGEMQVLDALIAAVRAKGLNPLPIFLHSLKDDACAEFVARQIDEAAPDIILNLTGFAVSTPGAIRQPSVLERADCPILQVVLSSGSQADWDAGTQGLGARDVAMNVALPEVDGRIFTRAVAFKQRAAPSDLTQHACVRHMPLASRMTFVAEQAAAWVRLRRARPSERRVALILANYPNRDGRLANGVGLDTPAGAIEVLRAMKTAGYALSGEPETPAELMDILTAGPTNDRRKQLTLPGEVFPLADYDKFFANLPEGIQEQVTSRWGAPQQDPFFEPGVGFRLGLHQFGNIVVGVQPARGYNINPVESYHSPDLPPPHGYFAFYAWLRQTFGAHTVIHMGKHGNLEWLPGKALALSESCFPEAVFGPLPHLYPFIVNDPGEGTQAKRRASAVIIDHLTPPMTRAESYGPLKDLEGLVDEYYEAASVDTRRLKPLRQSILEAAARAGLDRDGVYSPGDEDEAISALDNYLCELKEMQIRDGLHIFGRAPEGRLLTDLAVSIARAPRQNGEGANASLLRALSQDMDLSFDPLDCRLGDAWQGSRPPLLSGLSAGTWRTNGDTVERLENLAASLVSGEAVDGNWPNTRAVMGYVSAHLLPALTACGAGEIAGLMRGLEGHFVMPGSSGAPTRGRPDVLPTGKNFYSVDTRSVPTRTAWALGWKSAQLLVEDYRQREGMWPRAMTLSAWGTSNMRTGGDDVAQALALMGARPKWDDASRRVTGFEILPLALLGRPRVDVTFRVSGFFRDAFAEQVDLIDSAARAIMKLEECEADNPLAARYLSERDKYTAGGAAEYIADMRAGARVFGSKPGAYGAGLQALIDEGIWQERRDLGAAYLEWGGYAYGGGQAGRADRAALAQRIQQTDAIVHNQDNREHDLLDSDDYYQFEGGLAAAAEMLRGSAPVIYHTDHSRPETPKVRTLAEEIARIVRARAVNPKWIEGVMRHGYKGAFEMAATLDYLFAFAATTDAVKDHQFDLLYDAYMADTDVSGFIRENNPAALREMAARFREALERSLWKPRRNSIRLELDALLSQFPQPLKERPR